MGVKVPGLRGTDEVGEANAPLTEITVVVGVGGGRGEQGGGQREHQVSAAVPLAAVLRHPE